jgi:hypothetical protein
MTAGGAGAAPPAAEAEVRMDLPKWNRARVKRSAPADAPTDDAFQQTVRKAGSGAVRRGPLVLGLIVLVAGAIAGGIAWTRSREETRAEQTRLLAEAAKWRARARITELPPEIAKRKRPLSEPFAKDEAEVSAKIDRALADLDALAPGSASDAMAKLIEGGRLLEQGSFAEAEAAYRAFLEQVGDAHQLAFLAREGVAFAREGQGDLDGAIAELDALAGQPGDFFRDEALWQKGRMLEALGRVDDATAVYKQYAQEYPLEQSSIAQVEVRERLTELDPASVPPEPEGGGVPPGGMPIPGL